MTDFVPANRLEEILVRAASDPEARPAFYRELLDAELFFVTPEVPKRDAKWTADAGTQLRLLVWKGPNGPYTPFFSSRQAVEQVARQVAAPVGFVALTGKSAFALLSQHPQPAVLNPGLPYGKAFEPSEIQQLADGSFFEPGQQIEIQKPTQVLLGHPAVYPQQLVDALIRQFAATATVRAAFLAQIHFPESKLPPHPVIGIESTNYAGDVRAAAAVVRATMGAAVPVDFVSVSSATNGTIESYLRDETTPFYRRSGSE